MYSYNETGFQRLLSKIKMYHIYGCEHNYIINTRFLPSPYHPIRLFMGVSYIHMHADTQCMCLVYKERIRYSYMDNRCFVRYYLGIVCSIASICI